MTTLNTALTTADSRGLILALTPVTHALAEHNQQLAQITHRTRDAFERTSSEWQNGFQTLDAAKALLRQELEVLQRENSELEAAQRGEVEELDARVNAQALVLSSQQQTLEGFRAQNDVFVNGLKAVEKDYTQIKAGLWRESVKCSLDPNRAMNWFLSHYATCHVGARDCRSPSNKLSNLYPFRSPAEETDKILAQYPGAF